MVIVNKERGINAKLINITNTFVDLIKPPL